MYILLQALFLLVLLRVGAKLVRRRCSHSQETVFCSGLLCALACPTTHGFVPVSGSGDTLYNLPPLHRLLLRVSCVIPLRASIADDGFYEVVHEAYLAFEALSQHPYDFVSYLHGHNPELLCMNESAEIATDESCIAQFEVARVDRYVDTDLQHALVILSMISKMVFRFRLRWVTEAAPIFGPHNRVSNLILRTQRGKMAPEGSPESGDARELARALGDGTISDLSGKTFCELKTIYRLCFPSEKGIGRCVVESLTFRPASSRTSSRCFWQRFAAFVQGKPSDITP